MEYFEVTFDSDPKVTGLKKGGAQVEIDEKGEEFFKIKAFFMTLKYWERKDFIPDFNVKIESAILLKGAKLTDFLHFTPRMIGCPFMVDEEVNELFEQFSLPEHYYWPVTIDKIHSSYSLFYLPFLGFEYVDFENCLFYTGYELLNNVKFYRINSLEEFQNFNRGEILRVKELAFNDRFNKGWDMFNSRLGGLFVSEQLKLAIENSNLLGLNFLSTTRIRN
jgi:hypothetical protein